MSELKLLNDKTIEEVIDYIIETYHEPLPELIDKLNAKGRLFFYGHDDIEELKELREMFFNCTSGLFVHINEEEDKQFPLLINKINNPGIDVNMDIISKINGDHYLFDKIFFELESKLKNIDIDNNSLNYEDYKDLLDLFSIFHKDTLAHMKIETELLEDFLQIMKEKGIEINL